MRIRKSFIIIITVLLSIFLLASCNKKAEPAATAPEKAAETTAETAGETSEEISAEPKKDTLVIALPSEPVTLHPSTAAERITYLPVHAIHETLVTENYTTGEIEPRLAESWEISEDGLKYTFKIRQGIKFHNGDPLTADDVVYTLNEISSKIVDVYGLIKNVTKVDENTVSFEMEYQFSPILYLLSNTQSCIVDQEYYEKDPEGYGRNPNGTGPFKFKSWLSGENIVLERNEDYWRGPAPLASITFKVVPEEATKLIALESGDIDAYIQASLTNKPIVEENSELKWIETSAGQVFTLAFNNGTHSDGTKSVFADNKALREAIVFAIDKNEIVSLAIDDAAPPLYTPFPTFIQNYPANFEGNLYNVEKAKEKLIEAGYPDGFKFTMKTTSQPIYAKPAEAIQGQLAKIGIEMELIQMERGTYLQEVYQNFDYDATIWAVSCDYPDMDSGAYKRFYSGNIAPGKNYMQINDPAMDEAIMINRSSQDPAEKAAQVLKVSEIIRDEVYALPLYASPNTMAVRSDLKGVNINYGMMIDFYLWSR